MYCGFSKGVLADEDLHQKLKRLGYKGFIYIYIYVYIIYIYIYIIYIYIYILYIYVYYRHVKNLSNY